MFDIIRWVKEPAICGSYSIRHKLAHVLGTYRVSDCLYNTFTLGMKNGIDSIEIKEDDKDGETGRNE